MLIFRPRKFTFFPFLVLFKRIESIDMTPCVISFLVDHCLFILLKTCCKLNTLDSPVEADIRFAISSLWHCKRSDKTLDMYKE